MELPIGLNMVGDCGAICSLISSALPWGDHLSDAGGVEDRAVWGGGMADEAVHHRPGSAVIDGAIRDVADMRKARFAMLCRSAVPRGPHHCFGGIVSREKNLAVFAVLLPKWRARGDSTLKP